jgi:mRNA-degrading endonuclease RelE of RelBE toxin-antitoxin system
MNYRIVVTTPFSKQFKRLIRKYPSLKVEFEKLITSLKENPIRGKYIGNSCYKIRLAIASKGQGKSGGARVITHVQITHENVYLISIYDKSEQPDISDKDLDNWLRNI